MKERADEIYHLAISNDEKIKCLEELLLDCKNEMEAQDQNMHPEVQHELSEGYRAAKNYIRLLQ